jgi:bacterioferritin
MIGENVKECLECDLRLELAGHPDLKAAIAHCEKVQDYVSRDLFEDILESEEEHIDWLETNLELIEKVGIQNYLQSQMEPGDD